MKRSKLVSTLLLGSICNTFFVSDITKNSFSCETTSCIQQCRIATIERGYSVQHATFEIKRQSNRAVNTVLPNTNIQIHPKHTFFSKKTLTSLKLQITPLYLFIISFAADRESNLSATNRRPSADSRKNSTVLRPPSRAKKFLKMQSKEQTHTRLNYRFLHTPFDLYNVHSCNLAIHFTHN